MQVSEILMIPLSHLLWPSVIEQPLLILLARRHSQLYVQNILWAKRDGHDDVSTTNDHMQPAFVGLYKNVALGPTFWR